MAVNAIPKVAFFAVVAMVWAGIFSHASFAPAHVASRSYVDTLSSLRKTCTLLDANETTDIAAAIDEAVFAYQVDVRLIFAVMSTESGCKIKVKSNRGAMGLMQIMPDTARWLGISDPYRVRDNVMGGTKYLSYLLKEFNGDLPLALAAYNAGPATVKRFKRIPPYRETTNYVKKVIHKYELLTKQIV